MELLDLPPEIFQRITHILVKKHGIAEAWKVRGTSSKSHVTMHLSKNIALIYWISEAFQTYITYEVLATPSLYAYQRRVPDAKFSSTSSPTSSTHAAQS
jgi:hypothetical protein